MSGQHAFAFIMAPTVRNRCVKWISHALVTLVQSTPQCSRRKQAEVCAAFRLHAVAAVPRSSRTLNKRFFNGKCAKHLWCQGCFQTKTAMNSQKTWLKHVPKESKYTLI